MSSTVSEDSHLNALNIVKIELVVYIDRGCFFFELLIRQGQKHTFLPKHANDWLHSFSFQYMLQIINFAFVCDS